MTEAYEANVDQVVEFVVNNADRLHYSTVVAIAQDLGYDADLLLEEVRNV